MTSKKTEQKHEIKVKFVPFTENIMIMQDDIELESPEILKTIFKDDKAFIEELYEKLKAKGLRESDELWKKLHEHYGSYNPVQHFNRHQNCFWKDILIALDNYDHPQTETLRQTIAEMIREKYNGFVSEANLGASSWGRIVPSLPKMPTENFFFADGKIYIAKFEEVDAPFTNAEDYLKKYSFSVRENYERQVQNIKNWYERKVNAVEENVHRNLKSAIRDAMLKAAQFMKFGWTYDGECLVLQKKIFAKRIRNGNKIYKIPEKYKETFYVENPRIGIADKVSGATAEGAYHPNVNNDGESMGGICLGDINGFQIDEFMKNFTDTIEIVNLNSSYGNAAEGTAKQIIREIRDGDQEEDYDPEEDYSDDEDEESWVASDQVWRG